MMGVVGSRIGHAADGHSGLEDDWRVPQPPATALQPVEVATSVVATPALPYAVLLPPKASALLSVAPPPLMPGEFASSQAALAAGPMVAF